MTPAYDEPLLEVEGLTVRLPTNDGVVHAVTDLSFAVRPGEALGVVGESGSGKTVMSLALLGLLGDGARVGGSVRLRGRELLGAAEVELRRVRGNGVAMVFQDALAGLHPYYPVGRQVAEGYRAHHDVSRRAARERAVDALARVGIADPRRLADEFPHQLSGGMRQRVMIAMAIVNEPQLLIADEPTTALDVTVQAQILDLLQGLRDELGSALVLISHDLAVVAQACERLLVMYGGRLVETGGSRDVLTAPRMPYTQALLASMPDLTTPEGRLRSIAGAPPTLLDPPTGCPFHPRCPRVHEVPGTLCRTALPRLRTDPRRPAAAHDRSVHAWRCHLGDPDVGRDEGVPGD